MQISRASPLLRSWVCCWVETDNVCEKTQPAGEESPEPPLQTRKLQHTERGLCWGDLQCRGGGREDILSSKNQCSASVTEKMTFWGTLVFCGEKDPSKVTEVWHAARADAAVLEHGDKHAGGTPQKLRMRVLWPWSHFYLVCLNWEDIVTLNSHKKRLF